MGAKTVEEILASGMNDMEARWVIGKLRAAGLLLEPGSRLRVIRLLNWWVGYVQGRRVAPEDKVAETDALLRELAGAGEPVPVVSIDDAEYVDEIGPDEVWPLLVLRGPCPRCKGEQAVGLHLCPDWKPMRVPAWMQKELEEASAEVASWPESLKRGERILDEPASPASAPRRMVGTVYSRGIHNGEHDEDPQCVYCGCRPVEPSKVRRMQANVRCLSFHGREHYEVADCSDGTPCVPVEPPTPRRMRGNPAFTGLHHGREHDELPTCDGRFPGTGDPCQPVAPSSKGTVDPDCRGDHAPGQVWFGHECARCWLTESAPSSTEAAGPSPECGENRHTACLKLECSCRCHVLRRPTLPPHVHQWAADRWLYDYDPSGRHVVGHRVTREHCVADGCTEPPAMRDVTHGN